jgi:hypothetical protein
LQAAAEEYSAIRCNVSRWSDATGGADLVRCGTCPRSFGGEGSPQDDGQQRARGYLVHALPDLEERRLALLLAQQLLRHESVAMTQTYLHPNRDDLAAALRALDQPTGEPL